MGAFVIVVLSVFFSAAVHAVFIRHRFRTFRVKVLALSSHGNA